MAIGGLGIASADDPYKMCPIFSTFGPPVRYNNYPARTQVSPILQGAEITRCILAIGDSMIANTVPTAYTVTQAKNQTLNPMNGGLYTSADPMLGASNGEGAPNIASPITRHGDQLIIQNKCARAINCNIAYASTTISDWGIGGCFNQDIGVAYQRFSRNGLAVHGIIWHGGPNDTAAGTSQSAYAASLNSMISTIRGYLPTTPILIGVCTRGPSGVSAAIQAAQQGVVNHGAGIWEGVDSDAYNVATHFQAGPGHFSDTGSAAIASDYVTKLTAAGAV